ncbi:MAG: MarR family transcriptional regulator [Dehalococcoidia bacterium]|nr:MAG: MarR family transcriptional regulator [Dehalococcoidia bacterium]
MHKVSKEDKCFNLWLLLLKTRRVLYRAREKELAQYGITPEQGEILFINRAKKGNVNQTDIARLMAREPHTIGGIIKRMEKKGFVEKYEDPKVKNAKKITITNKGKKVMERVDSRVTINNIMSILTENECSQLWILLEKLLNAGIKELDRFYVSPYTQLIE